MPKALDRISRDPDTVPTLPHIDRHSAAAANCSRFSTTRTMFFAHRLKRMRSCARTRYRAAPNINNTKIDHHHIRLTTRVVCLTTNKQNLLCKSETVPNPTVCTIFAAVLSPPNTNADHTREPIAIDTTNWMDAALNTKYNRCSIVRHQRIRQIFRHCTSGMLFVYNFQWWMENNIDQFHRCTHIGQRLYVVRMCFMNELFDRKNYASDAKRAHWTEVDCGWLWWCWTDWWHVKQFGAIAKLKHAIWIEIQQKHNTTHNNDICFYFINRSKNCCFRERYTFFFF